uniref:Uncharacterized protein n=1 Tax=Rhizophora mucronata TaxID=61149 RepID=A0A2P2IP41_RHIMU
MAFLTVSQHALTRSPSFSHKRVSISLPFHRRHCRYRIPTNVSGSIARGSRVLPLICSSVDGSSCSNSNNKRKTLKTCKNCKTQFDPSLNHLFACRFHTAHFGGETKRKFESVYTGGTMNTPESGRVFQYWHCCGSEDPLDPGCTAAPHASYDD